MPNLQLSAEQQARELETIKTTLIELNTIVDEYNAHTPRSIEIKKLAAKSLRTLELALGVKASGH